jgi:hypothetical protein
MDIVGSLWNAKINDDKVKNKIKNLKEHLRAKIWSAHAFVGRFSFFLLLLLLNCVVSRWTDVNFTFGL